jgi:Ser/Thr protein kinase RdoA (MazF antagonist)
LKTAQLLFRHRPVNTYCAFIVNTKKAIRIFQRELDFIGYLGANGIPSAPSFANRRGLLVTHLDQQGNVWQAVLMPYMLGSHADHYSNRLLINLATTQAKMHNLAASYPVSEDTQATELTELRENRFIQLIRDRKKLDPPLQDFIARAENYAVRLDGALPKGLCHLDFDNDNVLSQNLDSRLM